MIARSLALLVPLLVPLLLALHLAAPALACAPLDYGATPWPAATERDEGAKPIRRFIPPELYTGAPWRGEREIALRPVEVTRKPLSPSDHPAISFTGPMPWGAIPR
jgi:hypothetical protein